MSYQPVRNYVEFDVRIERYHDGHEETGRYLEVFDTLRNRPSYSNADVKTLVDVYLYEWGGLKRHGAIPRPGTPSNLELQDNILRELNDDSKLVSDIKQIRFEDLTSSNLQTVKSLFKSLRNVQFHESGRTRHLGSTAVGKTLHMLAWRSCIIWDDVYVKNRGGKRCYSDEEDGYAQYLSDKRAELDTILQRQSVHEIETRHAKFLQAKGFRDAYEPITKMLDELNYY
ncbi:MAG: hypothetical protein ACLP9K_09525 [Nitrososphaerales archaeon]